MAQKVLFSWSGGKDSARALHELQKNSKYQISGLLTTVTQDYERISMHGIRETLLKKQAISMGYPLEEVFISKNASNDEYEIKTQQVLEKHHKAGVSAVVYGDIFLQDLRKYREESLARIGMKAVFPIWQRNSNDLANEFIDLGFKAIVTCIDSEVLGKEFVGRIFDRRFLNDLPPGIDPCGENGEFHSFAFQGPIFANPIPFELGEIVLRNNRFYFCDLIPSQV